MYNYSNIGLQIWALNLTFVQFYEPNNQLKIYFAKKYSLKWYLVKPK